MWQCGHMHTEEQGPEEGVRDPLELAIRHPMWMLGIILVSFVRVVHARNC